MTVFEAYITNLGKYAEGQLVGETLKFPATTEEVQSLLKNIGVDGVLYEEFFITAFDGDVMGLYDYLTEYKNLDELNHLAHLISELDSDEIETLEAALNKGDHTSSVEDIINLVHNLDCYDLHPGVTDDETLGRIYVEDMELLLKRTKNKMLSTMPFISAYLLLLIDEQVIQSVTNRNGITIRLIFSWTFQPLGLVLLPVFLAITTLLLLRLNRTYDIF